jgi:hypothetical protein
VISRVVLSVHVEHEGKTFEHEVITNGDLADPWYVDALLRELMFAATEANHELAGES